MHRKAIFEYPFKDVYLFPLQIIVLCTHHWRRHMTYQ